MWNISKMLITVGLAIGSAAPAAWALHCGAEAPLFSVAGSHDVMGGTAQFFTVAARDKGEPGCLTSEIVTMRAVGLPPGAKVFASVEGPGEAAITVMVGPSAPESLAEVMYSATDTLGNSTTLSLPLRIGRSNSTPTLDPVSDLVVTTEVVSFTIGVSDRDKDLLPSPETLTIDGLPNGSSKKYTRMTSDRHACRIMIDQALARPGVYRVHIVGKDGRGGFATAQMRIQIF